MQVVDGLERNGKRVPVSGNRSLWESLASLYAAQFATWLVPFITVPYLARVLGVEEWGRYSLALALSGQLALLVECGLGISGNRQVARLRGDSDAISRALGAGVMSKCVLIVVACIVAAVEYARIPALHANPLLFWFAAAAGVTQGANFSWCLYGLDRISTAVALELGARLLAAASVLLIHAPTDDWRFFAMQTVANAISLAAGVACLMRLNPVCRPSRCAVVAMLREGLGAMLCRPGFGIYLGAYTFVLGLFASGRALGEYAGAERIIRGIAALTAPLCLAVFPRLNYAVASNSCDSRRLRALGGLGSLAVGVAASVGTLVFAPFLIRAVLGPSFGSAVVLLRLLSPLPLLAAMNQVLLYQHLLTDGVFGYVAACLGGSAVLAVVLIVALGRAGDASSIACAACGAEAGALICLATRVFGVGDGVVAAS